MITKKTERRILFYILAIAIAFPLILAFTIAAEGAAPNPPKTERWETTRAVRQAGLQLRAHFGRINAANKACGPAIAAYSLAGRQATNWNLNASSRTLRRAARAMNRCGQ